MWTVYTKQFTLGVWGMLVAAVFSLGLGLACVSRYTQSEVSVPPLDSVLTVVGFLFGQGESFSFRYGRDSVCERKLW